MITSADAKKMAHGLVVKSLRDRKAPDVFKGPNLKDGDFKKLNKAMKDLAEFLEKRGKLNDQADAGGESKSEDVEVPAVRESET